MARNYPILPLLVASMIVLVALAAFLYPTRAVTLFVRTERSTYNRGEAVNFSITLSVTGNRAVALPIAAPPGPCNALYYAVQDEANEPIFGGRRFLYSCPLMTSTLVPPGETRVWTLMWNQVNDSGSPVPPGHSYKILALLWTTETVSVATAPAWVFVN